MRPPPILSESPPPDLPRFLAARHHGLGDVFALDTRAGAPTAYCVGSAAVREMFAREREGGLAVHNTATVHTLFRRAVFTLRGREHETVRTYLSAGLRHDAVAAYLPSVAEVAHRHVSRWAEAAVVALYQAARDYTMEVCLTAILGLAADDPTALRVPELFDRFVVGAELPPTHSEGGDEVFAAALDAAVELRELLQACTVRAADSARPSVVSALIASGRAPGGEGVDHLLALLIAARETTASLVTWLLIECALDDQLADALATDARDLVTDPVQAIVRGGAPGLRRVLAECARLHTPNTIATRQAVTDVQVGGYTIPAGWHVAYSAPATHLLPELFTDPEAFHPQRFCGPDGARRAAGLLAFGRGAHACAGRGFAEATTLLLVAVVLAGYRIDLDPRQRPKVERFQPVRAPAGSVHARVRQVVRR
ncbi:cytochrome P450 [Nocardia sp. NBC_01730]|uniref:cytochrome P450 n=1 Tax=Nocardia sp. NBC_01730 TaxID=2975998 RepID=UPI002E0FF7A5|nr:cytochrome P450 [Nocardia sp. NBC_01730]